MKRRLERCWLSENRAHGCEVLFGMKGELMAGNRCGRLEMKS